MKKILSTIIILATLIPNITFGAFAVPWSATSTSQGWVSPNTVNGVNFIVRAISFIASSTTSSSIFPYASTTALSANTLCLTADTCRTTWPTGGSSVGWASTTADINSVYFTGDNIGKVGIGSSSPYSLLSVTNTGTIPSLVVEDSTSPDSTPFIIDASGNVGIASSTPGAKLSIFTSSDVNNTYIDSSSNNNFALTVRNSGGTGKGLTVNVGNTGSDATIISANNLSGTNFFTVSDGNSYFQNGNVGIGSTSPYASLSITNTGTSPSFIVEDSTSPDTTPFLIDASGNVGIGTTNPGYTLHVNSTTGTYGLRVEGKQTWLDDRVLVGGVNQDPDLYLYESSADAGKVSWNKTNNYLALSTRVGSTDYVDSLVVKNGNVGIGTTTPNALLAINPDGISTDVFVVASSTANKFVITNGGNVGISVAKPSSGLQVNTTGLIGSASALGSNIDIGAGRIAVGSSLYSYGGICANAGTVTCGNAGGVVIGTTNASAFTNFPTTGNSFTGSKFGVGSSSPFATLSVVNSRTTAGGTPLLIVASTTNGTATTTFMVIDSSGNVGIGTTTPVSVLNTVSDISDFRFSTGASAVTPTISVINTSGSGKAAALLAGTSGAAFDFDSAGNFYIMTEAKTAFTQNNVGSGSVYTTILGSNGNFGIATTTPSSKLSVVGTTYLNGAVYTSSTVTLAGLTGATGGTNNALCISSTGIVLNETTGTCTVSSLKFKKDIIPLKLNGLDTILKLKPVEYSYKEDDKSDYKDRQYGFIAEEVSAVDPHLAKYGLDGKARTLDDRAMLAASIKAIQELKTEIDSLKAEIKLLKSNKK